MTAADAAGGVVDAGGVAEAGGVAYIVRLILHRLGKQKERFKTFNPLSVFLALAFKLKR